MRALPPDLHTTLGLIAWAGVFCVLGLVFVGTAAWVIVAELRRIRRHLTAVDRLSHSADPDRVKPSTT